MERGSWPVPTGAAMGRHDLSRDQAVPIADRETITSIQQQTADQLMEPQKALEAISVSVSGPRASADNVGMPVPTGAVQMASHIRGQAFRLTEMAREIYREL